MNSLKCLLCAVFLTSLGCADGGKKPYAKVEGTGPAANVPRAADMVGLRYSGPITHQNLSVYIVHGPDALPGRKFLTLQEALSQKKIVVHETGQVNELAVENKGDVDVFIQGGELVRGGRQDRMIESDLIVTAHSAKVPISSFCVEQGRWRKRGSESSDCFSSAENYAPSNSMKIAAKLYKDQGSVWSGVAMTQRKLGRSVGSPVESAESQSSIELTLDNEKVQKRKAEYLTTLSSLASKDADAIGAVVIVNGEIASADVYCSHDLFVKLWPKLIEASAVEAIADIKDIPAGSIPTLERVEKFVSESAGSKAEQHRVSATTALEVHKLSRHVRFVTSDAKAAGSAIHINCLSTDNVEQPNTKQGVNRSEAPRQQGR